MKSATHHWSGRVQLCQARLMPANLAPGESVTVTAAVKAPQLSEPANKREEFTLSWDVRNTASGQWISQSRNIPALDQSASVANPTSNQIGLERFYQYTAARARVRVRWC